MCCEGGAVYTAERGGKFYVITEESTMAEFLSEEDAKDLANYLQPHGRVFDSAQERDCYLMKRYGPGDNIRSYDSENITNITTVIKSVDNTMTNNKAKSINIFLLDGDTDGVRMAQIAMSTIQAIAFRRPQFPRVKQEFKEISRPGVYLLFGINPSDPDSKLAYIGESESVEERLKNHNNNEQFDFWTDTIALISKDDNMTKSHARYVEALLITSANENKRWSLKNSQNPPEAGKLPKPDRAAMDEFITQSKMLVGTLGWVLFKPITTHQLDTQNPSGGNCLELTVSPEFYFSGSEYSATAVVSQTTGEWIIKKGSKARMTTANSVPERHLKTARSTSRRRHYGR
jgi:GIY-YIG catalytic domain.